MMEKFLIFLFGFCTGKAILSFVTLRNLEKIKVVCSKLKKKLEEVEESDSNRI